MKYILLLLITLGTLSCKKGGNQSVIAVDLTKCSADVKYSQLIKSVDYITLTPGDTCLLSGIQKIYFDDDTIIVQDTKKDGICIFTHNGEFIKQINYIGDGPGEYHNSNAIAVDTISNHIYIYDVMNFKINKYTYQGEFIESNKIEYFMQDFDVIENGHQIMIQPHNNKAYKKNGVWLCSSDNRFIKQLIEHKSNEQEFEFVSTFYNKTSEGVYYYDRNDDHIYLINADSAKKVYTIELTQRIPDEIRDLPNPSPADLEQHSMMYDFCVSPKYIAFTYFTFENKDHPFRWVFWDRKKNTHIVCRNFKNDFDQIESSDYRLFHVNDSTWCRVADTNEKDCNTLLQIMHLK